MKVSKLIKLLQQHNQEANVETEGCDCIGEPNGVVTLEEYFSKGNYALRYVGDIDVIITRTKS